jgi:parvulin-like peptidyl-prolyl isomerase
MLKRIAFVMLVSAGLAACNADRSAYVAEVHGRKISSEEFTTRYDKYRAQTSERDNIVLRKKILNNMVNEILILDDVHDSGLDHDSTYEEKYKDIRDQALLDGYAKLLTVDTMSVSEEELYKEFKAYNTKASARFLYARTEAEASTLKSQLQQGVSFSTLAKAVFSDPGLSRSGGYLGFFGYGEMEPALQQVAFSLPVGVLSDPVKLRIGYAIVRVEKRMEIPLASSADYAKVRPKLEDAIRERKIMELLKKEGDNIEQDLGLVFNEESLKKVMSSWDYISKQELARPINEDRYKDIEDIAALPLFQSKTQNWTVKQFVEAAEKTRPKYRRYVRTIEDLRKVAEGLAIRTVLLQKAKDAGLEREPRVELQVRLARENYLLHRWSDLAEDSVSAGAIKEMTVRAYYDKHKDEFMDPPLVNAAEILVQTQSEATLLRKEIDEGVDFGMLARTHSMRPSAARRNGELGYVAPSAFGSMSEKMVHAKVGDILGPEFLNPNYVILKVLGRKAPRQRGFEDSKAAIVQSMLPELKQQAFWEAVAHLRTHAKVEMNIEALGNVVVASN